MKKNIIFNVFVVLLFFLFSLVKTNSYATEKKNVYKNVEGNKYRLADEYIKYPEKFIHINSRCRLCMSARSTNAGCVVVKNDKILLVRDSESGLLGLPGGLKDHKEISATTAARETLEETGLVVYIDDFISEFKNGFRLFKCKIIKDTGKTDGEITEFKYVDKVELGKLLSKNKRKDIRFPHELDLVYSKFEWIVK